MRVARITELVRADADAVFSYLTQIDRHAEWSGQERYGLEQMEMLTPGPVGLGTLGLKDERTPEKQRKEDSLLMESDRE